MESTRVGNSLFGSSLFALSLLLLFYKEQQELTAIYLKSDGSGLLLLLFTKRVTGANCSCHYLFKEQREHFALVTLFKRAKGVHVVFKQRTTEVIPSL